MACPSRFSFEILVEASTTPQYFHSAMLQNQHLVDDIKVYHWLEK
jgi:hypothetical protein